MPRSRPQVARATPHDALVKRVLGDPRRAAAYLASVLPPALVRELSWTSLRIVSPSCVDPKLRSAHADLGFLLSTTRRDAQLLVALEHLSDPRPITAATCLRRSLALALDLASASGRDARSPALPAVLSVVLVHRVRPWRGPTSIVASLPARFHRAGPFSALLDHRLVVDDLAAQSDDALLGRRLPSSVTVLLWLLRDARRRRGRAILESLPRWASVLDLVRSEAGGHELVETFLHYVANVVDAATIEAFLELFEHHPGFRAS